MRTICLVACAATKRDHLRQAKELYVSDLFEKPRTQVEWHAWQGYILFAKHHPPDAEGAVEPYKQTLRAMRIADRRRWARELVARTLDDRRTYSLRALIEVVQHSRS